MTQTAKWLVVILAALAALAVLGCKNPFVKDTQSQGAWPDQAAAVQAGSPALNAAVDKTGQDIQAADAGTDEAALALASPVLDLAPPASASVLNLARGVLQQKVKPALKAAAADNAQALALAQKQAADMKAAFEGAKAEVKAANDARDAAVKVAAVDVKKAVDAKIASDKALADYKTSENTKIRNVLFWLATGCFVVMGLAVGLSIYAMFSGAPNKLGWIVAGGSGAMAILFTILYHYLVEIEWIIGIGAGVVLACGIYYAVQRANAGKLGSDLQAAMDLATKALAATVSAIDKFRAWAKANPTATAVQCEAALVGFLQAEQTKTPAQDLVGQIRKVGA
jgi:hypothetical protein